MKQLKQMEVEQQSIQNRPAAGPSEQRREHDATVGRIGLHSVSRSSMQSALSSLHNTLSPPAATGGISYIGGDAERRCLAERQATAAHLRPPSTKARDSCAVQKKAKKAKCSRTDVLLVCALRLIFGSQLVQMLPRP